ncbi:MAG: hypothetical protein HY868_24275 [Chloroflexi bacterium]|nr:hypothetical protein [Chloroflexota bacterium]
MNKPEERRMSQATPVEEKKPYETPDVVYQAPLEAMATDCGASPGKADVSCGTEFS